MTKLISLGRASSETKDFYVSEFDNDGKVVSKHGHVAFCTRNVELAEQPQVLCQ